MLASRVVVHMLVAVFDTDQKREPQALDELVWDEHPLPVLDQGLQAKVVRNTPAIVRAVLGRAELHVVNWARLERAADAIARDKSASEAAALFALSEWLFSLHLPRVLSDAALIRSTWRLRRFIGTGVLSPLLVAQCLLRPRILASVQGAVLQVAGGSMIARRLTALPSIRACAGVDIEEVQRLNLEVRQCPSSAAIMGSLLTRPYC